MLTCFADVIAVSCKACWFAMCFLEFTLYVSQLFFYSERQAQHVVRACLFVLTNKLRPKSLLLHLSRSPCHWFYLGLWAASRKIPKTSRDWNKILRHGRHGLGSHRTCAVLQVKDWFWSRLRQRMWLKAVRQVPDNAKTGRLSGRFTSVGSCVELLQWGPGILTPWPGSWSKLLSCCESKKPCEKRTVKSCFLKQQGEV